MKQKRGQFFLLAAIILSAVIISLTLTANYVDVNDEPENFYDYTYEVTRESGGVVDYEIYTGFEDDENLNDFVDKMVLDLRDKDPAANFYFIYGNSSRVDIRNYGVDDIQAEGQNVEAGGNKVVSDISVAGTQTNVEYVRDEVSGVQKGYIEFSQSSSKKHFQVNIRDEERKFDLTQNKKIIVIFEKQEAEERYVDITS